MKTKVFLTNVLIKIKNIFINIYRYIIKMFKKTYKFIKKNDKSKKENIILYSLCALLLMLIVFIIVSLSVSNSKNDSYEVIKKSIMRMASYDEYNIDATIDFYNYANANELTNKLKLDFNAIKKKDNINMELLSIEEDTYSMLHIFFNNDRFEFIFGDDSYYARYKNIFSIVSNYLPSLTELSSDLSKLSYSKYRDEINKECRKYLKNSKNSEASKLIREFLDESNLDDELSTTYIDGTKYELKRYYIKKNSRELVKLNVDILKKIKEERQLRKLVRDINIGLLNTFKDNKDYEKIRMTSDEFKTFSYTYSNELVNYYDKKLDDKINNLSVLYSMLNKDEEAEIVLYISKNNDIKQIYINVPVLLEEKVVYIKSTIILSNINDIKSKDVVPKNNNRINTNDVSRSDLYIIVDKIKNKINILKDKYDETFK